MLHGLSRLVRRGDESLARSLRLGPEQGLSEGWQGFLPVALLAVGVAAALGAAVWLAMVWPPGRDFFRVAVFNGLLFIALWFALMPLFVVATVYAFKGALWLCRLPGRR